MTRTVLPPFPVFHDDNGSELESGYIYIGVANLDPIANPVSVYWDAALTTPASQPIRTVAGYPSNGGNPAMIYVGSDYSIQVQNKNAAVVYSAPKDTRFFTGGITSVASYTALRALTGMGTGDLVRVSAGTGIDGVFRYDSTQSATDNGVTIIQGWVRIYGGANSFSWGAAATDGSTDDTTPIATTVASQSSGGEISVKGSMAYQYGLINPGPLILNTADVATIGTDEQLTNGTYTGSATGWALSNFTYGSNAISHTAGTVGSASQSVTLSPYKIYLLTLTTTTTTFGLVDLYINGTNYFEGGIQLATGTATQKYSIVVPDTGSVIFELRTDTAWAGSIDDVSFIEVATPWGANSHFVSTDDATLKIPHGIKFGRFNAGVIGAGDKQTLALNQTAGTWNTAIGARAMATNHTGLENTAIGALALQYSDGSYNTAIGYSALKYNTNGGQNTAVGFKSYVANGAGVRNTGLGYHSGFGNVGGTDNVSIGWQAGYSAKSVNGNTFIGSQCGMAHTGANNTLLGALSGYLNADVNVKYSYNYTTGLGSESKIYGNYGDAIGYQAQVGADGTAVDYSLAFGATAATTVAESVVIGYGSSASGGARNMAIGKQAAASGSSGADGQCTAVGFLSKTEGYAGTAVGSQAGTNITGNYCTFLGYTAGSEASAQTWLNVTCLGAAAKVTGSNQVQLGDSATTTYAYGAVQNRSDARDKADIRDTQLGLDFIKALRPRDFKWNYREDYVECIETVGANGDPEFHYIQHEKDGSRTRTRYHHGLVAQEVQAVLTDLGIDFGGFQDHSLKGGKDVMSIGYEELIGPLIKAVQELSEKVSVLEGNGGV